jgi:classical protein kinase C alpha type
MGIKWCQLTSEISQVVSKHSDLCRSQPAAFGWTPPHRKWYAVVGVDTLRLILMYRHLQSQQELDQKIQDVYKRIQTERKLIQASETLRRATPNQDVIRKTDTAIRESQRSLSYFEDTLRELQARKTQGQRASGLRSPRPADDPDRFASGSPSGLPSNPRPSDRERALPAPPPSFPADFEASRQSPDPSSSAGPRVKQYSNLGMFHRSPFLVLSPYHTLNTQDLIKADTPYTTAKIARMLQQLEFKLQVELQYKKAIIQMTKLYQADGDKKSRADAEVKRIESDKKSQLLQVALKKYRNLHILDDPEAEEGASIVPNRSRIIEHLRVRNNFRRSPTCRR